MEDSERCLNLVGVLTFVFLSYVAWAPCERTLSRKERCLASRMLVFNFSRDGKIIQAITLLKKKLCINLYILLENNKIKFIYYKCFVFMWEIVSYVFRWTCAQSLCHPRCVKISYCQLLEGQGNHILQ